MVLLASRGHKRCRRNRLRIGSDQRSARLLLVPQAPVHLGLVRDSESRLRPLGAPWTAGVVPIDPRWFGRILCSSSNLSVAQVVLKWRFWKLHRPKPKACVFQKSRLSALIVKIRRELALGCSDIGHLLEPVPSKRILAAGELGNGVNQDASIRPRYWDFGTAQFAIPNTVRVGRPLLRVAVDEHRWMIAQALPLITIFDGVNGDEKNVSSAGAREPPSLIISTVSSRQTDGNTRVQSTTANLLKLVAVEMWRYRTSVAAVLAPKSTSAVTPSFGPQ